MTPPEGIFFGINVRNIGVRYFVRFILFLIFGTKDLGSESTNLKIGTHIYMVSRGDIKVSVLTFIEGN